MSVGNRRTYIENSGSSDHIVEMIPPVNTLGREFLMANFYERESDVIRIIGMAIKLMIKNQRLNNIFLFYDISYG